MSFITLIYERKKVSITIEFLKIVARKICKLIEIIRMIPLQLMHFIILLVEIKVLMCGICSFVL